MPIINPSSGGGFSANATQNNDTQVSIDSNATDGVSNDVGHYSLTATSNNDGNAESILQLDAAVDSDLGLYTLTLTPTNCEADLTAEGATTSANARFSANLTGAEFQVSTNDGGDVALMNMVANSVTQNVIWNVALPVGYTMEWNLPARI